MHILYDPATLAVQCVMYDCHELTATHNRTLPNHIEHAEQIPHHLIHIEPHPEVPGKVVVSRKVEFASTLANESIRLGESAAISGVPAGTQIIVNGATLGEMDESGLLEFAPQTAGFYTISLVKRGWLTKEFRLEAVL